MTSHNDRINQRERGQRDEKNRGGAISAPDAEGSAVGVRSGANGARFEGRTGPPAGGGKADRGSNLKKVLHF
jgi:hypothetical protein